MTPKWGPLEYFFTAFISRKNMHENSVLPCVFFHNNVFVEVPLSPTHKPYQSIEAPRPPDGPARPSRFALEAFNTALNGSWAHEQEPFNKHTLWNLSAHKLPEIKRKQRDSLTLQVRIFKEPWTRFLGNTQKKMLKKLKGNHNVYICVYIYMYIVWIYLIDIIWYGFFKTWIWTFLNFNKSFEKKRTRRKKNSTKTHTLRGNGKPLFSPLILHRVAWVKQKSPRGRTGICFSFYFKKTMVYKCKVIFVD